MLSDTSRNTIEKIILEPILKEEQFCGFWGICETAQTQVNAGQIATLRDLEKFLCLKAVCIRIHSFFRCALKGTDAFHLEASTNFYRGVTPEAVTHFVMRFSAVLKRL